MFVETRTTHTEVLADVWGEVGRKANSVINSAVNHRAHPAFNTKTGIRNEYQQLLGMAELARLVSGHGVVPEDVAAKLTTAYEEVMAL